MCPLGGYWIHWQLLLMRLPTYLNRSWEWAQYGVLYTLKSAPMCSGSFLNVCNWTEVGWNAPADSRKLTIPALQQIERFPRCLALVLYLQGKRGQQHRSHLAISSRTSPADDQPCRQPSPFLAGENKAPGQRSVSGGNATKMARSKTQWEDVTGGVQMWLQQIQNFQSITFASAARP